MNQKQVHIEGKKAIKNKKRKILFGKPVVSLLNYQGMVKLNNFLKKGKDYILQKELGVQ